MINADYLANHILIMHPQRKAYIDLIGNSDGGRHIRICNNLKIMHPVIKACLLDIFVLTDYIL